MPDAREAGASARAAQQGWRRHRELFNARGGTKRPTPGGVQTVGFDTDTAEKTGLSKKAIKRSRRRAEKIAPDVQEDIKDTPTADSGVELDALASLSPDEQRQAVKRVEEGVVHRFEI